MKMYINLLFVLFAAPLFAQQNIMLELNQINDQSTQDLLFPTLESKSNSFSSWGASIYTKGKAFGKYNYVVGYRYRTASIGLSVDDFLPSPSLALADIHSIPLMLNRSFSPFQKGWLAKLNLDINAGPFLNKYSQAYAGEIHGIVPFLSDDPSIMQTTTTIASKQYFVTFEGSINVSIPISKRMRLHGGFGKHIGFKELANTNYIVNELGNLKETGNATTKGNYHSFNIGISRDFWKK